VIRKTQEKGGETKVHQKKIIKVQRENLTGLNLMKALIEYLKKEMLQKSASPKSKNLMLITHNLYSFIHFNLD
jgi:hypothetical protein